MHINKYQIAETIKRWESRKQKREKNKKMISEHKFFDIDSPDRVKKFLDRRGFDQRMINEIMKNPVGVTGEISIDKGDTLQLGLERILGTNDLLPIYYLDEGLNKSRSVGRIWVRNSNQQVIGYGTGSLISPQLMLTNNHVLPDSPTASQSLFELNFQMNTKGQMNKSEVFALDPQSFYYTNVHLDYSIVAVLPKNKNGVVLNSFGWNPLIEEEGKAIISQWVSIIQHPNGEPKQIGLRENQIIDMLDDFIQYQTDTSPGSSGSPVYNEKWEIVALHHSGVPRTNAAGDYLTTDGKIWTRAMGEDKIDWIANEGIRISKIIKDIRSKNLSQSERALFKETETFPSESVMKNFQPIADLSSGSNQKQFCSISDDGTAVWTIPVSISVKVGSMPSGANSVIQTSPSSTEDNSISSNTLNSSSSISTIDEILALAKKELGSRKDVVKVEWGYKFKNGWITNERCIVVTVMKRKTLSELKAESISPIDSKFRDYPVDVIEPNFSDLISHHLGQDKLETLISPIRPDVEEIRYVNPPGLSLERITDNMHVVAHVSPENGWKNLKSFIKSAKKSLTVAMYDFGAPHILDALKDLDNKQSFKDLMIVMQPGSSTGEGTKKDDLKDEDAIVELNNVFGNKFSNAWVNKGKVNGWISSSYHIKVAVADSKKFWLSSGNWQSSNQPNLSSPELNGKTHAQLFKSYNREWHVIVEHPALAKTYENYIQYDFNNNKQTVLPDEALLADLNFAVAEDLITDAHEAGVAYQQFNDFDDTRQFTVTPILTPDNYFDKVIDLIKSAQSKLYIHNQTFNAPKDGHEKLKELIDEVIDRQNAGVDVKIIFRNFIASVARENLTALKEAGLDVNCVKVHPKCHTKGILVDGKTVLLGSQNMSNDGISVNRDASLLFEDKPLAEYFEKIFMHDWAHAKQDIGSESLGVELLEPGQPTPKNKIRISWSEVLETL